MFLEITYVNDVQVSRHKQALLKGSKEVPGILLFALVNVDNNEVVSWLYLTKYVSHMTNTTHPTKHIPIIISKRHLEENIWNT